MKIDTGPGYRVYYKQTGKTVVVILCGGDKSSQDKDIERAKQIARSLLNGQKNGKAFEI